MSGIVSTLISTGLDAFQNLYDVLITFPLRVTNLTDGKQLEYSIRATSFDYTPLRVGSYDVTYKGISIKRLSPAITGERMFSITFREKYDFELYKYFQKWKHLWFDPSGDGKVLMGPYGEEANVDRNNYYGSITVQQYKASGDLSNISKINQNISLIWRFYNVICYDVSYTRPARESSTPVTFTVSFYYGQVFEPPETTEPSST